MVDSEGKAPINKTRQIRKRGNGVEKALMDLGHVKGRVNPHGARKNQPHGWRMGL